LEILNIGTDRDNVKITLGITCFNAEDSIDRAIQSALDQSWLNLEIIIVDDCSTDSSWNIILDYASRFSIIKPVQNEVNRGVALSRNRIIERAKGEFIAFFDDDDVSLPQRISQQYQTIVSYETCFNVTLLVCYCSGVRFYPNGYQHNISAIGSESLGPIGLEVVDYLLFNSRRFGRHYGAGVPSNSLMARSATFKLVGGFDTSFRRVEDVDFAIRVGMLGGHFIGCKDKLVSQYATYSPEKSALKNFECESLLIEKYADYLLSAGTYQYAKQWFKIRYLHFTKQRIAFLCALALLSIRYPFRLTTHLIRSVPQRWLHEKKMYAKNIR
jgi:glycosyltransferase involved in cell wall biosynthesis